MKVKEIINLINSSNIDSLSEAEDLLDNTVKLVAEDLEIERYKWFGVSTDVYEVEDGYIGITGVTEVYSTAMDSSDCDYPCIACEYEPYTTINYRPKNVNEFDKL